VIKGKSVVITGSTSGIGLGIAQAFAAQRANILLNGFGDPQTISQIQGDLEKKGSPKVAYCPADLTTWEGCVTLIQEAAHHLGSVDILVNNAGIQHVAPIEDFSREAWEKILALNLSAVFYTAQNALPFMRQRQWGRIINIASAHGLVASAHKSGYVAAKHGVMGLTKTIALETAGSGITCNAICPGWVLTPLVEKQIQIRATEKGLSFEEAKGDLLLEKQPSGEFVTSDQLGNIAVFLASESAAQITGTGLSVDGGWTAQ
jgi:3-hydroxybutyrate dehydrogenase